MGKTFKTFGLLLMACALVIGGPGDADAKKKKKKPSLKKMKYVGAAKCNGSCHDPYYEAWKDSPHGGTFNLLKPGKRAEAKKRVKLDPDKDYTTTPLCLRCHTTGYRQKGGFKPAGSKNKKGKDVSTKIDPDEPSLEQVGCEMCHSVAGGSEMRLVMKNTKGDFKKNETEEFGQRWDYANVCTRCHTHPNTPFKPSVHDKYKFNFEERKKKVHPIEKYWNADNEDQRLEKVKERAKQKAKSEKTPLIIEDFKVKKGKLRFKKGTKPFNKKKKEFVYKG
tara:strand:+ start:4141 stop:4974 length:834 start_codon:yes stop_codon:yes gene_type:complete